jgi:copper transport protein
MDRRRAVVSLVSGLFIVLLGTLSGAATARAQVGTNTNIQLTSTTPADGDTLTAAPPEIVLTFANTLPDIEAVIQLQNDKREILNTGQPIAFNNRMALRERVLEQNGLPAGTYTVTWLVHPKNTKPTSGKFTFTLQPGDTGTTVVGSGGATTDTVPTKVDTGGLGLAKGNSSGGFLGTIGRLLGYIGLATLVGGLILIGLAWAEGVEYVLTVRHLTAAWIMGFIGDLLLVGTAAADAKGGSIAKGLSPTSWGPLMHSSYGKVLVARVLFMAGCTWVARHPERIVDASQQMMAIAAPALTVITYGWSRHPATFIAIPVGIVHMLSVSAWFGGAALLARVVLAGPGEDDLVQAIRKFRGIAIPALLLTFVTGIMEAATRLGGGRNLLNTGYGKLLVLKIMVVVLMAFVGLINRQFARERLARAPHLGPRPAARLQRSTRTELWLGILALLLTAGLISAGSPNAAATDAASANRSVLSSADGTFSVQVIFGPKRVGARVEVHVVVLKPKSLSDGLITFTPDDTNTASIQVPILGTPRYGFGPDQGFLFPASGTWTMTITGKGPNGDLAPLSTQFDVANQDGSSPIPTSSTVVPETTRATVPDTKPQFNVNNGRPTTTKPGKTLTTDGGGAINVPN